jgi:hypothetical protein
MTPRPAAATGEQLTPELILVAPPDVARLERERLPDASIPFWVTAVQATEESRHEVVTDLFLRRVERGHPPRYLRNKALGRRLSGPQAGCATSRHRRRSAAISWSPPMKPGRDHGRVRPLALALVALAGIGAIVLLVRPHGEQVVARKAPHPSVRSSSPPAAKSAAHAVPAAPEPTAAAATPAAPTAAVSPVIESARRHAGRVPREPVVRVHAAAKRPRAKTETATGEPPDIDTPRIETDAPPPPPEALTITDPQIVATTSSSVQLAFKTSLPAQTRVSYGIGTPVIWSEVSATATLDHQVTIDGLAFSTTYQVWFHAIDDYGQTQAAALTVTTAPMDDQTIATTSGSKILLNGQPFFPIMVWQQCADGFGSSIDDGVNLFLGEGCGDKQQDRRLATDVSGRAYSVVSADDAATAGRGVIGWYFPDEWDAFLESNVTRSDLADQIPEGQPGKISFLTLTNHFYSRAEPLPQGRGMYPLLYSLADVLGFDLYPLQVWCKPSFGDVMDAQHELGGATGGKPTLQWIEVARMEHPCNQNPMLDPTPATVKAETWLAIAGGADGIGYFPNRWKGDIGAAIADTNRQLQSLAPALLAPTATASADAPAVRVAARSLNGALYVIAVNTGYDTVQTKISVAGIAGRSAAVVGDGTVRGSDDTGFTDTLGPLAARVYVIPPQGW